MRKAAYSSLFRQLGFSVAFLCSSVSGSAFASGLLGWLDSQEAQPVLPPPKVMMDGFRADAGLPANYLHAHGDVDYSLKLAYYSQYATEHSTVAVATVAATGPRHAASSERSHWATGYLDDDSISAAHPVLTDAQPVAPSHPESRARPVQVAAAVLPWHVGMARATPVTSVQPVVSKPIKVVMLKNQSIQEMLAKNESLAAPQLHMPAAAQIPMPDLSPQTATGALSDQDKNIIANLPAEKRKRHPKLEPVHIQHMQKNPLDSDGTEVEKHTGVGIQISIRRPKADIENMLENAYQDLLAGDQEGAIGLYKSVLQIQPDNKLALFGLATTYHRAGQLQMARPLYARLLEIDPTNVEGLNNYLVLLADEAPEEALVELGRLERTHPDFSPIPAQIAIIYEKQGHYIEAARKMMVAINLSPENLKYRYDMAIMLDRSGDWTDAAEFYQQLIQASERGEKIAADPDEIQQRLTFILSNKPKGQVLRD